MANISMENDGLIDGMPRDERGYWHPERGKGCASPRDSSTNTTPSGCRRESGGFSGGTNCATTSSGVVSVRFRSGQLMKY